MAAASTSISSTPSARRLGRAVELIAYEGADFNGIFDELAGGAYDCVIAGTTVTRSAAQGRVRPALSDLGTVARGRQRTRLPAVRSVDDLAGLTIGVQQGNTSQPIAERLVASGRPGRPGLRLRRRPVGADGSCDGWLRCRS